MEKSLLNRKQFSFKKYLLIYTGIFVLAAFLCFIHFWINGKTFVWHNDGYTQHYKALLYFARWMRSVIKEIFINHNFNFSTFSFSFGLGSDAFTTLQYYVIGDPFDILSVFVPSKYMVHYYDFMILMRLYISGLTFSLYAGYMGKKRNAALVGAIAYAFCSFALYSSVRHPYFINPMVFFPLLLLGVEKIRNEQKPWLMIAIVAMAAISNFYFFYMLVLLVVFYVLLVSFVPWEKGTFKKKIVSIFKIGFYSFTGVLIGTITFLPVVLLFLADSRSENGYTFNLLYPLAYYRKILSSLITCEIPGKWTIIGISAVAIVSVFLLFIKKDKNRFRLKVAFVLAFAAFLIPLAGYISNGFSYVANRWSWGFAFLFAYIFSEMWQDLFKLTKKEASYLLISVSVYLGICIISYHNISKNFFFSLCIVVATVLILALNRHLIQNNAKGVFSKITAERLLIALLIIGIGANAFFRYSPFSYNYVDEFKEASSFQEELYANETQAIMQADNSKNFYRYSGTKLASNASVLNGLSNTQYFWSLSNGAITDLYNHTLVSVEMLDNLNGFDSRTALEELSATKYFVTTKKDYSQVPYGYKLSSDTKVKKPNGKNKTYYVYKNKYALPLGFTYSSSLSQQQAESLTALELQEAMLQSVVLDKDIKNRENTQLSFRNTSVDYKIICNSDQITQQGNSFVVTSRDQTATLIFSGLKNSETYLSVKNLRFTGHSDCELYNDDASIDPLELYNNKTWKQLNKKTQIHLLYSYLSYDEPSNFDLSVTAQHKDGSDTQKNLNYQTSKYIWYNDRTNFLFNLCYSESPVVSVTINFPNIGVYSFDDIEILCESMSGYKDNISALKENVLENVDMHKSDAYTTNCITGNISLDKAKILFLSIPYSSGWTAYVDGKEAEIMKANYAYMALELDAGEHEIELRYDTPGMKLGFCTFTLGIVTVAFIAAFKVIISRRKKRASVNDK